ncbi:iron-siderophore ABC transporter substrate-binding protein [Rubellimicrobium aerolatum]|uniref:Iron-siderophore ABC transporter substrate-binding protein n=1 Tax=Rubellimicrobium aerolatum TaxID=490979 RepID=A0ABW0SHX0_9RHOB|nr:iron-siderophore ABC transporter substrate-binding protein [Rubellimicrobium aerolatum]MBP1807534.1 iron complex transport system substrate-binding protein [Rubellimicrobium aerolatum]
MTHATPRRAAALLLLLLPAAPAVSQEFPQTFQHRFGTTAVEAEPERVVSLDYGGPDDLLALGVVPVAQRYWYGDYPLGTWPWAREALGDASFDLIEGDLNLERIAALRPDVILAVHAGIGAEDYELLSQIAPVIAPEPPYDEYSTPWQERARLKGRALGRSEEAEAQVRAIEDRLAAIRAEHPEWQGRTATVAVHWNGAPAAFLPNDSRAQLLAQMGFATPPAIAGAVPSDSFYATFSDEDPSPLDADVLLWLGDGTTLPEIRDMPLRRTLQAHREGREAYADELLSGALSFSSLLSLPYALDRLVPMLEAAADGDPATPVPESVAAGLTD